MAPIPLGEEVRFLSEDSNPMVDYFQKPKPDQLGGEEIFPGEGVTLVGNKLAAFARGFRQAKSNSSDNTLRVECFYDYGNFPESWAIKRRGWICSVLKEQGVAATSILRYSTFSSNLGGIVRLAYGSLEPVVPSLGSDWPIKPATGRKSPADPMDAKTETKVSFDSKEGIKVEIEITYVERKSGEGGDTTYNHLAKKFPLELTITPQGQLESVTASFKAFEAKLKGYKILRALQETKFSVKFSRSVTFDDQAAYVLIKEWSDKLKASLSNTIQVTKSFKLNVETYVFAKTKGKYNGDDPVKFGGGIAVSYEFP